MRLLLDTHVWLWMIAAPEKLPASTRALLRDPGNELLLSAASAWEIAIKYAIGKLPLPEPPDRYLPPRLLRDGVRSLPVEQSHALAVASLPPLHNDPFDRMLVAQAQVEGLTLLTVDAQVRAYAGSCAIG